MLRRSILGEKGYDWRKKGLGYLRRVGSLIKEKSLTQLQLWIVGWHSITLEGPECLEVHASFDAPMVSL